MNLRFHLNLSWCRCRSLCWRRSSVLVGGEIGESESPNRVWRLDCAPFQKVGSTNWELEYLVVHGEVAVVVLYWNEFKPGH